MLTYEDITGWWGKKENKDKVVLAMCYVAVFLVGYGTGSFAKNTKPTATKSPYNYSTSQPKTPAVKAVAQTPTTNPAAVAGTATGTNSGCLIKGNISTGNKKIYHVPGGALYKVVKPEQCFSTEAEAVAAGFVKSKR